MPVGQGLAGVKPDFGSAAKTRGVVRTEAGGCFRVVFRYQIINGGEPLFLLEERNLAAYGARRFGNRGNAFGQCFNIHSGSTNNHRRFISGAGGGDFGFAQFQPIDNIAVNRGIVYAVEPVRDTRAVRCGRCGGENGNIAIYLHRIGIDDDTVQPFCQCQGKTGFSGCGRTGDDDYFRGLHEASSTRF